MADLLKPEDLRKISDDEDMAKAKKALERVKVEDDERAGRREIFMSREIHPEAKARINNAVRRAAQAGERQLLARRNRRFSSDRVMVGPPSADPAYCRVAISACCSLPRAALF